MSFDACLWIQLASGLLLVCSSEHVCRIFCCKFANIVFFTMRRYASVVCAMAICLCLLSQIGVLLKWLNTGSHK